VNEIKKITPERNYGIKRKHSFEQKVVTHRKEDFISYPLKNNKKILFVQTCRLK